MFSRFVFCGDFLFAVISGSNLQLKERFAVGDEYFRFLRHYFSLVKLIFLYTGNGISFINHQLNFLEL